MALRRVTRLRHVWSSYFVWWCSVCKWSYGVLHESAHRYCSIQSIWTREGGARGFHFSGRNEALLCLLRNRNVRELEPPSSIPGMLPDWKSSNLNALLQGPMSPRIGKRVTCVSAAFVRGQSPYIADILIVEIAFNIESHLGRSRDQLRLCATLSPVLGLGTDYFTRLISSWEAGPMSAGM